jgi:hypothetical protein
MSSHPALQKAEPSNSYVRLFVGRHRRLFTIVGALVVFTTFVVNEEFKENVKENNDALSSALQLYEIESNFTEIERELTHLSGEVSQRPGNGSVTFPDVEGLLSDIKPVLPMLNRKELVKADAQYTVLQEKLRNLEKNYLPDELKNLISLKDEIRQFASNVLGQAERRQQERQQQYSYWKVASFIMFVLGWGLALASQILGIEGLS